MDRNISYAKQGGAYVIKLMVEEVFASFGVPYTCIIRSDQGRQFELQALVPYHTCCKPGKACNFNDNNEQG